MIIEVRDQIVVFLNTQGYSRGLNAVGSLRPILERESQAITGLTSYVFLLGDVREKATRNSWQIRYTMGVALLEPVRSKDDEDAYMRLSDEVRDSFITRESFADCQIVGLAELPVFSPEEYMANGLLGCVIGVELLRVT